MQIIKVDGVGDLAFPDGMTDQQISEAIYSNFPELKPVQQEVKSGFFDGTRQRMQQTEQEVMQQTAVPELPNTSYDAMTGASFEPPKEYDTFLEATSKGLGNVPSRFQQSYAGLVKMVGEDMQGHRRARIEDTSRRLGIKPEDYLLLAWAGNEGLIDRKAKINQETITSIKQRAFDELTDVQIQQVMNMGLFNPNDIVNYSNDVIRKAKANSENVNAEPGSVAYYTSSAITSTAEMLPALVAGILTRNPSVSMAMIGGQVSGQQYEEGREKGLDPQKARHFAMASAAAEAIPEYLPLSQLLKPGTSFLRKSFDVAASNAIQEMLTEAINIGLEKGFLDENTTWAEARSRLFDAGVIGVIAGPMMAGVATPIQYGQAKVEQALAPSADQQFAQALQAQVDSTDLGGAQEAAIQAMDPAAQGGQQLDNGTTLNRPQQEQTVAQRVLQRLSERGAMPNGFIPVVNTEQKGTVDDVVKDEAEVFLSQPPEVSVVQDPPVVEELPIGQLDQVSNQVIAQAETPAAALAGDKIDKDWVAFSEDTGTKNISRSDMPQIKAEHRGALTQFMKSRGVTHEPQTVSATDLKPTQAEFSPAKVKTAMDFEGGNRSILVSSDNHVLDGHHQWLASREKGDQVDVIRFNAPIEQLVTLAKEFPSAKLADGTAAIDINKASRESILDQYKKLGQEVPDRDISVASELSGGMMRRIQQAVGRDISIKEIQSLTSLADRKSAFESGQKQSEASLVTEDKKPEVKTKPASKPEDVKSEPKKVTKPEAKPKTSKKDDGTSAMMLNMGADVPMPNHQSTYMQLGIPNRPAGESFKLGDREVRLPDLEKPRDKKGIRYRVEQIIGPVIYNGKVKGKSKLGFYRSSNSEIRIANYDNVEVLAHEMAHYLDMHYSHAGRFTSAYKASDVSQEVENLSYTSDKDLRGKEGFAEYVRLWLTQYNEAKSRAPVFTERFESILKQDGKLNKRMQNLQEEMHKYYLQGAHAQLRANQGDRVTTAEAMMKTLGDLPAEMLRQRTLDRIHAAKVVERTLYGDINDATASAYKMFQMINGAESVHEAVIKDGTPGLKADGTFEFTGKGLNDVFWPVAKKGAKEFNLLMDYFAARRASELMKQDRENLFTKEQIKAGLDLATNRPDFKKVFDEFQAFNKRMLQFYEQMGLLTADQRSAFEEMNKNYVPFQRIIERVEQGDYANTNKIGVRLRGGEQNIKDIAGNIIGGLQANIKAALVARAKNQLFNDISRHEDGSIFAAKIAPDSKLVKADLSQTAQSMAQALVEMGMTVSKDGMIIAGDPAANAPIDINEIASTLAANPNLLTFWTFGHKPKTSETFVDSAVIDGKRVWFEVHSPLVVDMLTSMGSVKAGAFMQTIFRVKNIQTRLITSMLQFLGPNAVRDTVSATLISKNKFVPIYSTLEGMGHFLWNSDTYKQFRLQGGAFGTRIEARTEEMRSRRQLDVPSRSLWDASAKALAGWDRAASLFEYGSRVGDYANAIRGGKNAMQAAWEAREVSTDFAKMGSGEAWSMYLRTVPFMNAGLQGMDKTVREVMEIKGEMKGANLTKLHREKTAFLLKGSVVTALTVLLWIINSDDERYQGLTPDEKARFWWIFPPGLDRAIKIPRPYDIGHIFATIPETALDYIKKRDGKEAAKILGFTAVNTLGIGDYPGILQPYMEALRNETFTGSPIIPQNLQGVSPQYQFTDRTPQVYRKLGETLGVSPLLAQHYAKGYFRYLEAYIADATETALWNSEQWGERPFDRKGPIDYFGQQFIGRKVPYRTKWTEGYYELRQRASVAKGDFAALQREAIRDDKLLKEFADKGINQGLISLDNAFRQVDAAFKDQTAIIASYKYNKEMTKDQKEAAIDHYYAQKNNALRQFYEQARVQIEKIEQAMRNK